MFSACLQDCCARGAARPNFCAMSEILSRLCRAVQPAAPPWCCRGAIVRSKGCSVATCHPAWSAWTMFSAPYYQLILRVATGGQLCRSHVRAGGLSGWTAVAQDVVRARAGTWDGTEAGATSCKQTRCMCRGEAMWGMSRSDGEDRRKVERKRCVRVTRTSQSVHVERVVQAGGARSR